MLTRIGAKYHAGSQSGRLRAQPITYIRSRLFGRRVSHLAQSLVIALGLVILPSAVLVPCTCEMHTGLMPVPDEHHSAPTDQTATDNTSADGNAAEQNARTGAYSHHCAHGALDPKPQHNASKSPSDVPVASEPLPSSDESPEQCSHCVVSVLERPLATQPQLENDRLRELRPDLHGDATAHASFPVAWYVSQAGQSLSIQDRKLIPPGSLSPPFHLAIVPVYLQNSVFTC